MHNDYEHILTEVRGHIFIITFNRDEVRNAMNAKMRGEIRHAMEGFEADGNLRAAIITHVGNCFCSGSDLKEIAAGKHYPPDEYKNKEHWGFGALTRHVFSKPVILAIEGKCLGGGAEILLAQDMAIVSEDSTISMPEVKQGLMPDMGGAGTAMRQLSTKIAMELLLSAQPITAQRAYEIGLVNHVVPKGQALARAVELAEKICENAPVAVRYTKAMAYKSLDTSLYYTTNSWDMFGYYKKLNEQTEDSKEGPKAFAEKRPPRWRNC